MLVTESALVICSKSMWHPSVRREHAVARSAAADRRVVFIEHALDARAALDPRTRARWLRGLRSPAGDAEPNIEILTQSTLAPGHHSRAARWTDALRLQSTLRRIAGVRSSTVVATQPWQWPAVMATPVGRRVFDCADDWSALIPRASAAIAHLIDRISDEADAVILASPALAGAFAADAPTIVRNGTDQTMLRTPMTPVPPQPRMVYAGTLSERFDAPLMAAVLDRLPDWSLELYGECRYAGHDAAPNPELRALLERYRARVRWHGPVERPALIAALDRGRVLIAPMRAARTRGQDSMKLYDYAARGRAIVSTVGAFGPGSEIADGGVAQARTAGEFARAATAASTDADELRAARRAWAVANAWSRRWPAWSRAAFGADDGQVSAACA